MGLTTRLRPVKSLALGVGEVKLLELTSAYSTFANSGIHVEPFAVGRIASRNGVTLVPKRTSGRSKQAFSPQTAFIMVTMLKDVMDRGTGGSSRWKWRFHRPAGGKTGTTNDYGDAWFLGFTPELACGVWVGFDQRADMGRQHTGAGAALPIWAQFMRTGLDTLGAPFTEFVMPEGVEEVEVCKDTYLRATRYCPTRYTEYFRSDEIPMECDVHRIQLRTPERPREDAGSRFRF